MAVDTANDIAEFLTSRRARVTPEQVGLPTYGARRVKGLRREEVASLAGVSIEYYKRLERGNATGVSYSVLDALAQALRLDDAERAHLFDLARAANPIAPKRRRPAPQRVRPVVLRILESITAPAIVRNSRVDYLAANPLGRALRAGVRQPRAAGQQRALRVPGPGRAGVLRRLGAHRKGFGGPPAVRGRPQPLRPWPLRPGRRAVNTQRAVPHLVGGA